MLRKAKTEIHGQRIPVPHLTRWGWWYLFAYLIAPFLTVLGLLDTLLYLLFRYGFNQCYGLWCYF